MSSKNKILLRKIGAVSLAAAMLAGTGAAAEFGTWIGTNISVSAATTKETSSDSFEYKVNDNGNITITKFTGSETEVVIPSKIDGKPVTEIGIWAFSNCTSLTSVKIPASVTEIGYYALGYYYDEDYRKIPDFTIYGKKGTATEEYANDNGFEFVKKSLENNSTISKTSVPQNTSVTVTGAADGGFSVFSILIFFTEQNPSANFAEFVCR